jgi:hypothetical protein
VRTVVKADTPAVTVTKGKGQYPAPWVVESPEGAATTPAFKILNFYAPKANATTPASSSLPKIGVVGKFGPRTRGPCSAYPFLLGSA